MSDKITIEYYAGPTRLNLIGAVTAYRKNMLDDARRVGRLLCQINQVKDVEAQILDENGDLIETRTITR